MKTGTVGASTSGTAAKPRGEASYVVQVFTEITTATGLGSGTAEKECWADVAMVTVPAKTKRKTVIAKAVDQVPEILTDGKTILRVIPAEHAEPIKVEMEQPPPQLKIG
jgi:hypothetical protein